MFLQVGCLTSIATVITSLLKAIDITCIKEQSVHAVLKRYLLTVIYGKFSIADEVHIMKRE